MLRQISRVGELPKVAKQLQKVGCCSLLAKKHMHVLCSSTQSLLAAKTVNTCHYDRRFKSTSFFGLFQSSAIAGTQKSNNYATEATVQVQRVSERKMCLQRKILRRLHN